MENLFFKIGDKEMKLKKSLVKNHFKWLAKLFGIDTKFEEKKKLVYDILDYLPGTCDLEVISILKEINEWVYDREKYNEIVDSFNGRQAINFLKYGPSKIENIKKWQCIKCLKITNNIKNKKIQHKLKFFGSNDCAAVCINCGIRWTSLSSNHNGPIYCKKIEDECKHKWEEI